MIQLVDNSELELVHRILEEHFGNIIKDNPFLYYLKYEDTILKGILSYSLMYDRMELNYIWVALPFRRKKIGESLLKYLEQLAQEKKVNNITLEVECSNQAAVSLYLKLGYKIAAKREGYYHGSDGYLMIKEV